MTGSERQSLGLRIAISGVLIVLFLLGGVALFAALRSLKKPPEKNERTLPRTVVRVEPAERRAWQEEVRGYGLARAIRAASVAAEVSGVVEWVSPRLEAGNRVEEGEELVRLAKEEYGEALAAAKARLAQTQAAKTRANLDLENLGRRLELARDDLSAAERELERTRDLVGTGVLTQSELDRQRMAKTQREKEVVELENQRASLKEDLARVEAEVEAARAARERSAIDLARATIRAPWAGRVAARHVSPGNRVAPGTVVFDLVDTSRVEVPVALGATRYGEIGADAAAEIRMSEGGPVVWSGPVSRLSPVVDPKDRTFFAYLVVAEEEGRVAVPPGSFVLAEIEGLRHEDVIPVPRTAFVEDIVFVAKPADTPGVARVESRRPIVRRWLPSVALVESGIEAGELVVVTNIEQIAEGSRVQLVREEDAAAADDETARDGER